MVVAPARLGDCLAAARARLRRAIAHLGAQQLAEAGVGLAVVALPRLEKQHPQRRHAAEEVKREVARIFFECRYSTSSPHAAAGAVAVENKRDGAEAKPELLRSNMRTFSTLNDFTYKCYASDLVAVHMLLQRLEEKEVCDLVASVRKSIICLQGDLKEVEDEDCPAELHASYFHVPHVDWLNKLID